MKNRKCIDCDISIDTRGHNSTRCKKCYTIANRIYRVNWARNNKEKRKNSYIVSHHKNKHSSKNKMKYFERLKQRRSESQNLVDAYIKRLLANSRDSFSLEWDEIPSELIELKRKELRLKRELYSKKHGN